jgi:hypothetical protein
VQSSWAQPCALGRNRLLEPLQGLGQISAKIGLLLLPTPLTLHSLLLDLLLEVPHPATHLGHEPSQVRGQLLLDAIECSGE